MCRHESEVQIINKVLADQWQGAVLDSTVHISLFVYHYSTHNATYRNVLYSVLNEKKWSTDLAVHSCNIVFIPHILLPCQNLATRPPKLGRIFMSVMLVVVNIALSR